MSMPQSKVAVRLRLDVLCYIYLNIVTRLLFSPALIKFLATRLVALLVFIYQRLLWFVFDFIPKLTKFEFIITIFEHNFVYLSSQK